MELVFERRSRGLSEPEKPSTPPWSGSPRHRLQAVANTNCHGLGFSHGARGAKRAAAMLVSSVLFGGEGCLVGRNFLMGCGALSIVGVLGIVAVGCLAILGNTGSNTAGTDPGGPTSPEEPGAPEQAAPEPVADAPAPEPEPEPITLSGVGPQATETFRLEDGLMVARMSHQGESNFIVHPIDETGAQAGPTLANRIGAFEGSTALNAIAGTYLLNVDADGPWSVTLEQPRPRSAPNAREFSGSNMAATEPFSLNAGLARFEMSHQGASNFIVYLRDAAGNPVGMGLANEIGAFQGSQAVQVPADGIYLLTVDADGPWTIRVG